MGPSWPANGGETSSAVSFWTWRGLRVERSGAWESNVTVIIQEKERENPKNSEGFLDFVISTF